MPMPPLPSALLRSRIRSHFPSLSDGVDRPTAYFDGPAGSQVPRPVIDAVADYLAFHNANTGGVFRSSMSTDELILSSRERLAGFLGAGSPREVVFGANMTTLTYSLSRALRRTWAPGDEIVVTELDHQANVAPWRLAAEEAGVRVRTIDFDPATVTLDYEALASVLGPRTRLVAIGAASNVTGTINDVRRVAALAREAGALSFVDAVHYAPHQPTDVQALGCDFLVCSAYKFFGPHVGVLWGREELLEGIRPCKVPPAPDQGPERWETGTLAHEGIVGAAAAVEWIASLAPAAAASGWRDRIVAGMATIGGLEAELLDRLLEGLEAVPGIRTFAPPRGRPRTPTVALTLRGASPREVATRLAQEGICVWDGDFYASSVIDRLGLRASGGVVRIGLAPYNTEEEVDRLLACLRSIAGGAA
jgi:cysteine desulfurase family protein (TIGR01976 family)